MRIAYDVSPLATQRSGVGNYTAYLLEHLQQHGMDDIIPIAHGPRMNKTLWMQTKLRGHLRSIEPDIVHFTNAVAPIGLPQPFVLTIHDMTLWSHAKHHPLKRLLAMRPIVPFAARQAAAVIVPSHSVRADVIDRLGLQPERVHVVYEAAATRYTHAPSPALCEHVRQRTKGPFILFVGTLEPRKNVSRLLEAYAHVHRELPHKLVIAGAEGWQVGGIGNRIAQLGLGGCVMLTGYVPDALLHALYHRASLLVYPSLEEGFGLPIMEAMSAGTPVVTSNYGAMAEVAGDAAHLVEPKEIESIAAGLKITLTDATYAAELIERGRARAAQFTWARAAAETRAVYQHVLGTMHVHH